MLLQKEYSLLLKRTIVVEKKKRLVTAVTRNGEKCGKFTFFFRKKFYLSGKYSVPKFATSCSRETLATSMKHLTITYILFFWTTVSAGQTLQRFENETVEQFVTRLKPDSTEIAHKIIETSSWVKRKKIIIAFYTKPVVHIYSDPADTLRTQSTIGIIYIEKEKRQYQKILIDTFKEGSDIESLFFANADKDSDLELCVLLSYRPDLYSCKCDGVYYSTQIYDKPNLIMKLDTLKNLPEISRKLEGGFQGVARWDTEEEEAKFKTAAEVKKELKRLGYK